MKQDIIRLNEIKILNIRGYPVIVDRSLAELYGVSTKVMNQTVKRNAIRFPEHYMFQLTKPEFNHWKSQIVTSNSEKMGLRKLPYVFTEYGVAMLSGVLKSEIALNINIEIIQTFIDSRASTKHSPSLHRRVSEIETRLINQENKFNEIFNFISENKFPQSGIFFQNQIFDAYIFSSELIAKAKRSLILIDNYIDENTLLQLSKRNKKYRMVTKTGKTRAIVNLVNNNANYIDCQKRLEQSALNNEDKSFDFFCFQNESQVQAPPHHDNPYAFKIYAIEKMREMGYKQIVWLDASIVLVDDFSPIWEWIFQKGFFFEEAGHYAGSWCNESTLSYFGLTREQAMTMPMFAAGYCGFDFIWRVVTQGVGFK